MDAPPSSTTAPRPRPNALQRGLFVVLALACAVPWPVTSLAAWTLALGILVGLLGLGAWPKESKALSRWLIQGAIVALGLRLNIHQLVGEALDGLLLAIATIVGAMVAGLLLANVLRLERDLGLLLASGTAICGGSAISAVGASIRARSSDIAIATAVVFSLNALGVFVLPFVGRWAGLDASEFGVWAGVAIHDMASVNAVAKDYHALGAVAAGASALDTANVVKLTRVLWIAPVALLAALIWTRKGNGGEATIAEPSTRGWARFAQVMPWFIVWFVLACVLRTLVPALAHLADSIKLVSGCAFQLALFLIGAGVSWAAVRSAGARAFVHASLLWLLLAGATLAALAL